MITSGATGSEVENTAANHVVYTATANDIDTVGTKTFSLSGDDAGKFTINPTTGEVTFNTSPNYEAPTDHGTDNQYDFVVHANDGIHDATQAVSITVTNMDPTGGDTESLPLDEAALSGGTNEGSGADVFEGTLTFTAGSDPLTSFAFSSDLSGLSGDTDLFPGDELHWVRISDTEIQGRYPGGATAILLQLVPPVGGIAAGTSGEVSVVATLSRQPSSTPVSRARSHPFFDAGSVSVVATDSGGASATGSVSVSVKDDVPVATGQTASVTVYEDALGHSGPETPADHSIGDLDTDGDGTPDVAADADAATFSAATLASLVNYGADGSESVPIRLHVNASGTLVKDGDGNVVMSGGHQVFYQYVDAGTAAYFGFSTPPPSEPCCSALPTVKIKAEPLIRRMTMSSLRSLTTPTTPSRLISTGR